MTDTNSCELCRHEGGVILHRAPLFRVVAVNGSEGDAYPGFCRVIWNTHVREMSDLSPLERGLLMDAVFAVETAIREALQPDKINLASLGNMTPHLHWHVIPRFRDDPTFPSPIWAQSIVPPPVSPPRGQAYNKNERSRPDWQQAVRMAFVSMALVG
ncbi:MAG: HIT family protein [Betaproteobacteria bacterium]|nr:HIT family protein [Betaproteobacteria bacterium]